MNGSATGPPIAAPPPPTVARVVAAGLVAAVVDAIYGIVYFVAILGVITVPQFFQSIAAGLLGKAAFTGGPATAWLGVLLHATIGTIWAALYALAMGAVPGVRRRTATPAGALLAGLAWGAVVWLGMDLVVLPLSRARAVPVGSARFFLQLAAHVLLIGPAISLSLRPRAGGSQLAGRELKAQ